MPLTVDELEKVISQLHGDAIMDNSPAADCSSDMLQEIIESFRVQNLLSDEDVAGKEHSVSSLLMDEANSVILDILRRIKQEECMTGVNLDELMVKAYDVPAGKLFAEIGIRLTVRYMFQGKESLDQFKMWVVDAVVRQLIECRRRELREQRAGHEPRLKSYDQRAMDW